MSKQAAKKSAGSMEGERAPGPDHTSALSQTGNPTLSLAPAVSRRRPRQDSTARPSLKSSLTPTRLLCAALRLCSTMREKKMRKVRSEEVRGGCAITARLRTPPQEPHVTSASRNMALLPGARAASSFALLFTACAQTTSNGLDIPKKCSSLPRFSPHCIFRLPYSPEFSHSDSRPRSRSSSNTASCPREPRAPARAPFPAG
mmetsp:Transcript_58600/g.137693  ORF Transcript_58600/g.137693 Transcript_58600/m.137693 type:complete len:202 (+) Transcript_58600:706-1311(+)